MAPIGLDDRAGAVLEALAKDTWSSWDYQQRASSALKRGARIDLLDCCAGRKQPVHVGERTPCCVSGPLGVVVGRVFGLYLELDNESVGAGVSAHRPIIARVPTSGGNSTGTSTNPCPGSNVSSQCHAATSTRPTVGRPLTGGSRCRVPT